MIKKSKIKIPIYGGKMLIVFFDKESQDQIIKEYGVKDLANYDAVTLQAHGVVEFAMLFDTRRLTPGIIAHESKHLLNYIFKYNGLKLDLDNDEAECYLLTWIVNRVHEAARRYKLKIK